MKNVRIFYKKSGGMRFCSHLDITRFMARIIRRANLPVWYTEGFNPHLYLTFALPLPLGFKSEYEVLDIRLLDDEFDISSIPPLLNSFCPPDIRFISAAEPVKKASDVAAAEYLAEFDDKGALLNQLNDFLNAESLKVLKKTKRKEEKLIEIKDKIGDFSLCLSNSGDTLLKIVLPAGNFLNINPELIFSAFFESGKGDYYCYTVTKTALFDSDKKLFK